MPQHFLLSSAAKTLSLVKVMRLSDKAAFDAFKQIRWAGNAGDPVCPRCGCVAVYNYTTRRLFKCNRLVALGGSGAGQCPGSRWTSAPVDAGDSEASRGLPGSR